MKKFLIPLIIIVVIILGAKFLLFRGGPPPGMGGETPPPVVETAKITEIEVIDSIETTGRVEPPKIVDIIPRVDGHLEKIYFKEGAFVQKGDLLFLIDPNKYQIAVNQAKAGVKETKAALKEAEKNLARISELVEKEYASKAQYDDVIAKTDRTEALLDVKQAALAEAKRNLDNTRVHARISGKIGKVNFDEGNVVSPTSGPMARIVSLNPVYINYNISSDEYLKLLKNNKADDIREVEIQLPDGSTYPQKGYVVFYDNEIDSTTGTIDIRAELENPDYILLSGQYVNVIMYVGEPQKAVAVPQEAVLDNPRGKYVYILQKDNTVKNRPIQVGKQYKGYWTVTDGLKEGETVIVKGVQKLRPDAKVMTKEQMKNKKTPEKKQVKKDGK